MNLNTLALLCNEAERLCWRLAQYAKLDDSEERRAHASRLLPLAYARRRRRQRRHRIALNNFKIQPFNTEAGNG